MSPGRERVVDLAALDELIGLLRQDGYATWGPVVSGGAIGPGPVAGVGDLPVGWHDDQEAGTYRIRHDGDREVFGWAVGPQSWKARFFPPSEEVWSAPGRPSVGTGDAPGPAAPMALIGARPCEVAALGVLDRVLLGGPVGDPAYGQRRRDAFVIEAECGSPAATCFCPSMGTGPAAGPGQDIALTELPAGSDGQPRFLLRAGTERGAELIGRLPGTDPTDDDRAARQETLRDAAARIHRRMDGRGVPGLLARNPEHPRWEETAERCLACGNCTLVCPTCFCSDISDTTDLDGTTTRQRKWSSCFDLEHSFIHGGPVRRSRSSRYRQWMTHKLSTWWDQFGSSGCVGCGRCIAWCPVGIDITEEAAAIAATDGATTSGRERS